MANPDYLFEVSWEVCNKVGGIHTVISSKASTLKQQFNDKYILIGPGIWQEIEGNPEFEEDQSLFLSWKQKAFSEGLDFKIGRWKIPGNPIVILVNFSSFFEIKDKIFAEFWEKFKLDSLSGGWDYVEPVMFGYAAGKVIESYYRFFISSKDTIVAQFHEWMTSSGILFLKERIPQIATVFTTHATVMGRSIAGNNLPLYGELEKLDVSILAKNFNVQSKQSIEKIAANEADAFTTVSELTNIECKYFLGKTVDVVTPNGFEEKLLPDNKTWLSQRITGRKKLKSVVQAIINQKIPDDSFYINISGRYELKNKGIDLFIDALNQIESPTKTIVAFILVPAGHSGPRLDILERTHNENFDDPISSCYLTHYLFSKDNDPIIQRLFQSKLNNGLNQKVKVIFSPVYLDGKDGIINISYYDLLPAFDLTIYPSYYEPWGYTPLESIAFKIPTITTTLAGFSHWVNALQGVENNSVTIIERNDSNDKEVVENIKKTVLEYLQKDDDTIKKIGENAQFIAEQALWEKLIDHYFIAYEKALAKSKKRYLAYASKLATNHFILPVNTKPEWKKVLVKSKLPEKLKPLQELAYNLWWSWHDEANDLFRSISPKKWEECKQNPVHLLETLDFEDINNLEKNKTFQEKLIQVYQNFRDYLEKRKNNRSDLIAYFSMEYGLHHSIRIYSGGLGILAGDYLKQASDSNKNFVGIGLLYRYGYFEQEISPYGKQQEVYTAQKLSHLPIIPVRDERGEWIKIKLPFPGRVLIAKIWLLNIGTVSLYLMDTDVEENNDTDRKLTHHLYGGDREYRLQQEILLGIGGVKLLNRLRLNPVIYHLNEGHAAFIHLERLSQIINTQKFSFVQAYEMVRCSSLFTTHTPVPAGHDTFVEDLLRKYLGHFVEQMNVSWNTFMDWGKIQQENPSEKFSMSILASKFSQEINGVSQIHGEVSRKMFAPLWKNYFPQEINIGYVTNGVHFDTWTALEWKHIYQHVFDTNTLDLQKNTNEWTSIQKVDDEEIIQVKNTLRKTLFETIKQKLLYNLSNKTYAPSKMMDIINKIDDKSLTIGFARRFATYKRAHLLFKNKEKLAALVNNPDHPVQFIFAGKAHPADEAGKDLIKMIYDLSMEDIFAGKIIFIEDYNMAFAKTLIAGVDVWMNTPTRPLEASGTSGEKAVMNGVPNLSVLDGWWAEGYREGAGWALSKEKAFQNQEVQDEFDAEVLYNIIQKEIIPAFYGGDKGQPSKEWISQIKNTIAYISPRFTTRRMMNDYFKKYYSKLINQFDRLTKNDFEKLNNLVLWKNRIIQNWDKIELLELVLPDANNKPLELGDDFHAYVKLQLVGIEPESIGVEMVFGKKENETFTELIQTNQLKMIHKENNRVSFECNIPVTRAGVYDYAIRVYPKNEWMAHPYEMDLVKWL